MCVSVFICRQSILIPQIIGVIKPLLWKFLIVFLQNYEKRYLHLIFLVLQKSQKKRNVRKMSTILLVKKRRNEKLREKSDIFLLFTHNQSCKTIYK